MRFLFLDDSGKVHPNDISKFVVYGGVSFDEHVWHRVVRQVSGVKGAFFPNRNPHDWEIKSTEALVHKGWKKAKIRNMCGELMNLVERNGGRTYVAYLEKANAANGLDDARLVPLMFHRLMLQFLCELEYHDTTGTIVCDWSTYQMDHHVTRSIKSMVASQKLARLVGGITYGSSLSHETLQLSDLIAGGYRRRLEGNAALSALSDRIENLAFQKPAPAVDTKNNPVNSVFRVF